MQSRTAMERFVNWKCTWTTWYVQAHPSYSDGQGNNTGYCCLIGDVTEKLQHTLWTPLILWLLQFSFHWMSSFLLMKFLTGSSYMKWWKANKKTKFSSHCDQVRFIRRKTCLHHQKQETTEWVWNNCCTIKLEVICLLCFLASSISQ